MDDEKCIVFKKPVEAGGKTYDGIDLHEPNGREISKFFKVSEKEGAWEGGMALVAMVAGVDIEVISRAPSSNIQEAIDFCANFLNGGQAIGGT